MNRDVFRKMAAQIEMEGRAKGYKQAIKEMRREILAVLGRLAEKAANGGSGGTPRRKPRANSDQARVLQTVVETPGIQRAEIISRLRNGDTVIREQTVRSALGRLRRGGKIVQKDDGSWH